MAATTSPPTAAIIQAAESVVFEGEALIAKQITTKNATEIKTIVSGSSEGVAAVDDGASTILENIEDGAHAIVQEIVEGTEAAVDAIEKHPELIAEGALAVGIGVASIVAPPLAVGTVALVGKLAADATKETINEIVVESGSGIFKGIAKEAADEADKLAAPEAAEKLKSLGLNTAKNGAKEGEETAVDVKSIDNVVTNVVVSDGEAGKMVSATVSGDATSTIKSVQRVSQDAVSEVLSKSTMHTSTTAISDIKDKGENIVKIGAALLFTGDDLTGNTKTSARQGATTSVGLKTADTEAHAIESKLSAVSSIDAKAMVEAVVSEISAIKDSKQEINSKEAVGAAKAAEISSSNVLLESATSKLEADLKSSAAKSEIESLKKATQPEPLQGKDIDDDDVDESENKSKLQRLAKYSKGFIKPGSPVFQPGKEEYSGNQTPALVQPVVLHSVDPNEVDLHVERKTKSEKYEANEPKSLQHTSKFQDETDSVANQVDSKAENHENEAERGQKVERATEKKNDPALSVAHFSENSELSTSGSAAETKPRAGKTNTSERTMTLAGSVVKLESSTARTEKGNQVIASTNGFIPTAQELYSSKSTSANAEAERHAITHASLEHAHEKINALHKSHEALHQKLDTIQEALLAIIKTLGEKNTVTPEVQIAPEIQATEHNQLVLANPTVVSNRLSVFGSIGWLFGVGGGKGKEKGKGRARHTKGNSIATSTPASVPVSGVPGNSVPR